MIPQKWGKNISLPFCYCFKSRCEVSRRLKIEAPLNETLSRNKTKTSTDATADRSWTPSHTGIQGNFLNFLFENMCVSALQQGLDFPFFPVQTISSHSHFKFSALLIISHNVLAAVA